MDVTTGLGLRERKKLRTHQAIREAARRLIDEQGYDNTTIEQIAAVADVSPSTVFRYFPTKEHIVLTDDYTQITLAFLHDRPANEPPLAALREALTDMVRRLAEDFSAEYRWRRDLVQQVPSVRALVGELQDRMVETATAVLAERAGRPPDDFELRILVGATTGALHQVLWAHTGEEALLERITKAFSALSHLDSIATHPTH
jgi:AcrR family transcriptional regulator